MHNSKHLSNQANMTITPQHTIFVISIILVISSILVNNQQIEDGIIAGKIFWFHITTSIFAMCTFLFAFFKKSTRNYKFSLSDGMVIAFALITVLTYHWRANPAPEKMLFESQIFILWFLLHFLFVEYPIIKNIIIPLLLLLGIIESLLGLCQLYNLINSNHVLYKLTGSFYNPGPYSGFLATILPISIDTILKYKKQNKLTLSTQNLITYYIAWGYLILITILLPAGMSRTAWIAASISCGWVCWKRLSHNHFIDYIKRHRIQSFLLSITIVTIIATCGYWMYLFKKDSANGRLLLWKISTTVLMEHPLTGVGVGNFQVVYAKKQAEYFKSNKANQTEKMVADCSCFAFNDPLQIGVERGIIGMIIFVTLLGYSIHQGIINKHIGITGSILSLTIFSLASYPLQLTEFWIILLILLTLVDSPSNNTIHRVKKVIYFKNVLCISSLCFTFLAWQYYPYYKQWKYAKYLYNNGRQEEGSKLYQTLSLHIQHRPEVLFETALCLNRNKQYMEANKLLYKAMKLCAVPTLYHIAAKNEQILGNYQKAEELLRYVIQLLPERIFPYYLLVQLYSDPQYYKEKELIEAAKVVLNKPPKINSKVIQDMKEYVKQLEVFHE